ncbi:hypothetical protein CHH45_08765 [Paraclostridium bifermentans]|nr:hypothetical protein CHH45_08765 [Paraclostridium bifermentans]
MKSATNTYTLSKRFSLSSMLAIIALILICIDIFADIIILSIVGLLTIGCISLYDTIHNYKLYSIIQFFSLFNTVMSFTIAALDIFSIL